MAVLVIQVTPPRSSSFCAKGVAPLRDKKNVAVLWDNGGIALVPLLCERPHLPPEGPITLHSVYLQVPLLYIFTSRTMNRDLTSVYTSRI